MINSIRNSALFAGLALGYLICAIILAVVTITSTNEIHLPDLNLITSIIFVIAAIPAYMGYRFYKNKL